MAKLYHIVDNPSVLWLNSTIWQTSTDDTTAARTARWISMSDALADGDISYLPTEVYKCSRRSNDRLRLREDLHCRGDDSK